MSRKSDKSQAQDSEDAVQGRTTRVGGRGAQYRKNLQVQAFYMSVAGCTVREIAAELGIDKETAAKYVRDEDTIRETEFREGREREKSRRVARLSHLSRTAEECRGIPGSGALGACGKFEEMINKILGVDAPTKIDLGVDALLNSLNARDDDQT